MGFLISGDDTLRTLALRWTQIVRKIYFGGSNFLKVNNLGPVAGFFQSSALPTELLGRIETGRERGQGDKKGAIKTFLTGGVKKSTAAILPHPAVAGLGTRGRYAKKKAPHTRGLLPEHVPGEPGELCNLRVSANYMPMPPIPPMPPMSPWP